MGTKTDPGAFDCHEKALPDEPMFTLLARDPHAPHLVELWALQREAQINAGAKPQEDIPMVEEALQCAVDMRRWREENDGAWRA